MASQNDIAKTFKALHKPGDPIILTNVWDAISAKTVASLPEAKALATASYAVAQAAGVEDHDLDPETNLRAAKAVAKVAKAFNKPLTVDFQDGWGDKLEVEVRKIIQTGAVGINLEDFGRDLNGGKGGLYDIPVAQERIKKVMAIAKEEGVPDFVINARTDALLTGLEIKDAIERAQAYLDAGAHNTFIWGGRERGGTKRAEVEEASNALGGRLNVSLIRIVPGGLTVEELKQIGVARISVGPQLMLRSQPALGEEARKVLTGEGL